VMEARNPVHRFVLFPKGCSQDEMLFGSGSWFVSVLG
jgi:hypothetical protein